MILESLGSQTEQFHYRILRWNEAVFATLSFFSALQFMLIIDQYGFETAHLIGETYHYLAYTYLVVLYKDGISFI